MKTGYLKWILLGFIISGCLKPELDPLPFFEVETEQVELDDSGIIGNVILIGKIEGLGVNVLSDHGFLVSETKSDVEDKANVANSPYQLGPVSGTGSDIPFEYPGVVLTPGKTYFINAFAQKGERIVLGTPEEYQVGIGYFIDFEDRQNDILIFETTISGFQSQGEHFEVTGWGVQVSTDMTDFSEAVNFPYGAQSVDTSIVDTLFNLEFNTTYYFRPYAIGAEEDYGSVAEFRVTDGWKFVDTLEFPIGLYNAVAVSNGIEAYLVGGCLAFGCPVSVGENMEYFRFNLETDYGTGYWESLPGTAIYEAQISQGVGVLVENMVVVGAGQKGGAPIPKLVNVNSNQLIESCNNVDFEKHFNGVAFAISNSIYLGSGLNENGETINNFWQLKFDGDCFEIQAMPPLPRRVNGVDIIDGTGREGAISFHVNGRYFVGFGTEGLFELNDIYEFIPPDPGNGVDAEWSFIGYADIDVRYEASSFTIVSEQSERAFIGFGYNGTNGYIKDLWEFCPDDPENLWKKREPFPGRERRSAFAFSLNGYGYIGGGVYENYYGPNSGHRLLNDTWVYIPPTDN